MFTGRKIDRTSFRIPEFPLKSFGAATRRGGGKIPRDHWTEPWERQAINDYFDHLPRGLTLG